MPLSSVGFCRVQRTNMIKPAEHTLCSSLQTLACLQTRAVRWVVRPALESKTWASISPEFLSDHATPFPETQQPLWPGKRTFAFPGLFLGVLCSLLSQTVPISQWLASPAVPASPFWRAQLCCNACPPLLWDTSLLLVSLSRPREMQLLSSHLPWGHQARGALKSWG